MNVFRQYSVKVNAMMNFGMKVAGALCTLISYPYVFRVLGAEGVGRVAFATSVLSFFTMLATLGIPSYGVRECARVRDDKEQLTKVSHELLVIQAVTTLIATVLMALTVVMVPRFRSEPQLFAIQLFVLALSVLNTEWLFSGLEQYGYITLRVIALKSFTVVLIVALVRNVNDYLMYAMLLGFAVYMPNVLNLFGLRHFISARRSKQPYEFKRHIRPILIFFTQSAAITVYTSLDSAMLGFISGDYWVGMYDAAVKIKLILTYFITSLGTVLMPRLSNYVHRRKEADFHKSLAESAEFTMIAGLFLTVYFLLMAPECVELLFGAESLPAAGVLRVLAPTVLLIGGSNLTGLQALTPMGRESAVMWSMICGAVVDFVLNLLLIPRFSAVGAALGTLIAEAAVLGIQLWCLRDFFRGFRQEVHGGKILLAALLAAAAPVAVKLIIGPVPFVRIVVAAGAYAASFAALLFLLKVPMAFTMLNWLKGLVGEK